MGEDPVKPAVREVEASPVRKVQVPRQSGINPARTRGTVLTAIGFPGPPDRRAVGPCGYPSQRTGAAHPGKAGQAVDKRAGPLRSTPLVGDQTLTRHDLAL